MGIGRILSKGRVVELDGACGFDERKVAFLWTIDDPLRMTYEVRVVRVEEGMDGTEDAGIFKFHDAGPLQDVGVTTNETTYIRMTIRLKDGIRRCERA